MSSVVAGHKLTTEASGPSRDDDGRHAVNGPAMRAKRPKRIREFMAAAALAAFAFAMMGAPDRAHAQCVPTGPANPTGGTLNTSSSLSIQLENGSGTTVNVGAAGGGDGTYANNCVLNIVNRQNDVINIAVPATTTFTHAIVLDNASTGTTINVNGALGGTVSAIQDGDGANIVNIGTGADITAPISMGDGNDVVNFTGGSFSGGSTVALDGGDDTANVNLTAWSAGGSPTFDGGANNDTINATVDGGLDFIFPGNFFTFFSNFEHLGKDGAGGLVLEAAGGGESLLTGTVTAGTLQLIGTWAFTQDGGGNPTSVSIAAGAILTYGNGVDATAITILGDTDVFGTLNITANTTLNHGNGNADALRVEDGGIVNVNAGANVIATTVRVEGGGQLNVDGTISSDGDPLRVAGDLIVRNGGQYTSNVNTLIRQENNNPGARQGRIVVETGGVFTSVGLVSVQVTDEDATDRGIFVNGGQFIAQGATEILIFGRIVVNGGSYTSMGAVSMSSFTEIVVNGGEFIAQSTTDVGSGSEIIVDGGTYTAQGDVTMGNSGTIIVLSGLFHAQAMTNSNAVGGVVVQGGEYRASGAVLIQASSDFLVTGGLFNAESTTELTVSLATLGVLAGGEFRAGDTITITAGTVFGTGMITGGQVLDNVGGVLAPGGDDSGFDPGDGIGTLSFIGDYVQGAGGNFRGEIQPGGTSDLFAITGTASLAGNIEVVLLSAAQPGRQQFRLISSTAPLPTIFDTATVTGDGAGSAVVWVGRVDDAGIFNEADPSTGNNVDVIIGGPPASIPNLNPNQMAIAEALGSGFAGVAPGTVVIEDVAVYNALLVSIAGPDALNQLSPEVYDSFTAFSFNIARQFGGLVDTRVRTLRCASAAGPSAPFCGSGRTLLADGDQRADAGPGLAPGAPGTTSPNGFSPNTHPYGWSVWAQAIGSYVSLDQTSTNLGYSGWTGGGAMGVDLALSQRWIVGVLAGGTRSNIDFSGVSGDGDLDAVTVGVYTAWYGSRWFANAAFTYTKTWVEADRDLTFMAPATTAKGKTEGDQYAIHSTIGYGFKLRRFSLEATGGVDWVQLRQYGFTETGAGAFNLTVGSRTDDSLRLRAGIRVARAWRVRPNLIISPSLRVGYAREVLDNTRAITSTLAGFGGSFTVNGDEGSRNILTYGGGIQADFSQGITLYFRHSGEWAGDRTGHTFNGGIKVRW